MRSEGIGRFGSGLGVALAVAALAIGCEEESSAPITARPVDPAVSLKSASGQQSPMPEASPLPSSFPASTADSALRGSYGLSAVHLISHPEYKEPLKALVTRDDGGYELAYYFRSGEHYRVVDATQAVFGSELPSLAVEPVTKLPALRAQMRPTRDAYFFFVRKGKLESAVEHPEKWSTVKEPH